MEKEFTALVPLPEKEEVESALLEKRKKVCPSLTFPLTFKGTTG